MDPSITQLSCELIEQYVSPTVTSFVELDPTGAAPAIAILLGVAVWVAGTWASSTGTTAMTSTTSTQSTSAVNSVGGGCGC